MSKVFYSDTVESALAAARRSLGEETVLIEAGASPEPERARGAYRVVAESPASVNRQAGPLPGGRGGADLALLRDELERLRRAVDSAASLAARSVMAQPAAALAPELAEALRALLEQGMPPELVRQIADGSFRRLSPELSGGARPSAEAARRAVTAELESRLEARPGLGFDGARNAITALAGPPGAGKTTTLAKLAMRGAVAAKKTAAILSLDVFRIGAAAQLQSLAAILGLPFQVCETPACLRTALASFRQKDLVLIDTPGAGPTELEWWDGLAPLLAAEKEVEVQLVLPATASFRQLNLWIEQHSALRPARLVVTHVDESCAPGEFVAAAMTSGLPVSFLSTGQAIPEEIETASKSRLLELVLGRSGVAAAAA